jgi:hypothetical protein
MHGVISPSLVQAACRELQNGLKAGDIKGCHGVLGFTCHEHFGLFFHLGGTWELAHAERIKFQPRLDGAWTDGQGVRLWVELNFHHLRQNRILKIHIRGWAGTFSKAARKLP